MREMKNEHKTLIATSASGTATEFLAQNSQLLTLKKAVSNHIICNNSSYLFSTLSGA
jgi:hypothetical protein